MRIGITGKQTIVVDNAKTAEMLGSGDLPVF
ncbi:MAG: thioesterase, partial [Christensenellaceae bacterium]|nr:thioesterase [Christensenellaceae bacterium]